METIELPKATKEQATELIIAMQAALPNDISKAILLGICQVVLTEVVSDHYGGMSTNDLTDALAITVTNTLAGQSDLVGHARNSSAADRVRYRREAALRLTHVVLAALDDIGFGASIVKTPTGPKKGPI